MRRAVKFEVPWSLGEGSVAFGRPVLCVRVSGRSGRALAELCRARGDFLKLG